MVLNHFAVLWHFCFWLNLKKYVLQQKMIENHCYSIYIYIKWEEKREAESLFTIALFNNLSFDIGWLVYWYTIILCYSSLPLPYPIYRWMQTSTRIHKCAPMNSFLFVCLFESNNLLSKDELIVVSSISK